MKRCPIAYRAPSVVASIGMLLSSLLALTLLGPVNADSEGNGALTRHVQNDITSAALSHTHVGIEFYDLDTHRVVYSMNASQFFLAASTTKLLTEGTSLALLGPRFTFTTNVYRTGAIDDHGTLDGDVVLLANGDANLSGRIEKSGGLSFENEDHSYDAGPDTKAVPGDPLLVIRDLAGQIARNGIKRISGRVIVDDSLFPQFREHGTDVFVSPIVVNDNIVDVTVVPGAKVGEAARAIVSPKTPYARFIDAVKTGPGTSSRSVGFSSDITDGDGNHTVTISGSIPAGSPSILYAYRVPSPRRFAEVALTTALEQDGVAVKAPSHDTSLNHVALSRFYIAANVIATHASQPLSADTKVTLKVSDNLHADVMPYVWAAQVAHVQRDPLTAAFKLENAFLVKAGLDPREVVQSDGLGTGAYIEPSFMVQYLVYLRGQPFFDSIYMALPVLGVDGSLFNVQVGSPADGHVHAKTGSWDARDRLNGRVISISRGLAGYLTTRSGAHLAFCLYLNDFAVRGPKKAKDVAIQVLGKIAADAYLYGP